MNDNFPFWVEPTDYEVLRGVGKDRVTVLIVERQIFNWTIKRYTDEWSWNTQW